MRATAAALITVTGAVQRLPPAHAGTRPGAVQIAVIALPTEPHRCVAAATLIKSIGLFVVEHAGAVLDNAVPRGHKGRAKAPLSAPMR